MIEALRAWPHLTQLLAYNGDMTRAEHLAIVNEAILQLCAWGNSIPATQTGANGRARSLIVGASCVYPVRPTPYARDLEVVLAANPYSVLNVAGDVAQLTVSNDLTSDTLELNFAFDTSSEAAPNIEFAIWQGGMLNIGDGKADTVDARATITVENTGTVIMDLWAMQAFEVFNELLDEEP